MKSLLLSLLMLYLLVPVSAATSLSSARDHGDDVLIPFKYDPITTPFIVVQASINGQPALPFAVDTGASLPLILDSWAARRLGLHYSKPDLDINGGTSRFATASAGTMRLLGGHESRGVPLHTKGIEIDLRRKQIAVGNLDLLRVLGKRLAGIIGLPLLNSMGTGVRFDFSAKMMTVFPSADLSFGIVDATLLSLSETDISGCYSVEVTPVPGRNVNLLLDTGSMITQLPVGVTSQLRPVAVAAQYSISVGVFSVSDKLLVHSLPVGAYDVPNVVVGSTPDNRPCSLGLNILARFIVTIDFRNKQIVLQRLKQAVVAQVTGWTGISFRSSQTNYTVEKLEPESPAALAGVKVGDEVLSVDGRSLTGLPIYWVTRLICGLADTKINLQMRRGPSRKVVALSFYRKSIFDAPKDVVSGLTLTRLNHAPIHILAVDKDSTADKVGLRSGDQILALDRKLVAPMSTETLLESLAGSGLNLTVRSSGEMTTRTVHLNATRESH